ncbi:ABC transporter permease [Desulfosporosinus shakirovi]|uniref:ABC transporter permease n=1 Tax=Desulfosporosinus shakirovi TaxID=2885154 RepID=UPI001E39345C|nr:ABC transporter permease subunit [Desulfosporosinus sp. SRJS8]MCB8814821.1 ABC transporter permease subunit [Desulfosporosinus sp. SRJS8]
MVSRDSLKAYLYLTPALSVILIFFLGGFILAFIQSLGYFPAIGQEDLTFKYYREVLNKPEFFKSLSYTFYIALLSTTIATVSGTFLAYYLLRTSVKKSFIAFLYKFPIAVPHLVVALMIVFILSQGGILSRLLLKGGLISDTASFPAFFYTQNALGIILIYIWKEIPFVTFMVYTVMRNIHTKLGEAAQNLKASPGQVFFHVILPLSMPSIISASALVFAYSFGAFEVPYLLGATYPKTMPVWAYLNFISADLSARPIAMVINMIVSLVCAVSIFIYYLSAKKYLRKWS